MQYELSGQLYTPVTAFWGASGAHCQEAGYPPEPVWTLWKRGNFFVRAGNRTPSLRLV